MERADLEIGFHRRGADSYSVELRYTEAEERRGEGGEVDRRYAGQEPVSFDPAELLARWHDPEAYGTYLGERLFGDQELRSRFETILAIGEREDLELSLRLVPGPSAPELHNLLWETLRLPGSSDPLILRPSIRFTRYLSGLDWRQMRLRPKGELNALVVVAAPSDIATYGLIQVDAQRESAPVVAGLEGIDVTVLTGQGAAGLESIGRHLQAGYDIVYLIAHGRLHRQESWLFLEAEDGTTERVPGEALAQRIFDLEKRPRLVVLASCQSAADGSGSPAGDDVLQGLGSRMAENGVPAVLAMQGQISLETVTQFMPPFFTELGRDGQVDRALTVARNQVRDRPDWWMPVLFSRLRSGRIWYVPGFGDEAGRLRQWPSLVGAIRRRKCTPILGAGLSESLLGSRQELALDWASQYGYPMAPHSQDSLPQVAQYVATEQGLAFTWDEFQVGLSRRLLEPAEGGAPPSLTALLSQAVRAGGPSLEPIQGIAQLPVPIFVTADASGLLVEVLRGLGKDPVVELCPWTDPVIQLPSPLQQDPGFEPTESRPLVYHLFGHVDWPESLVLTEDHYFDFLAGISRNQALVDHRIKRALNDTALLFLGFQLDAWDFRVLYRSMMTLQEGVRRPDLHRHIAAQINPEEGRILEPEGARRYLADYFQASSSIHIFWGSAADFVQELGTRLAE